MDDELEESKDIEISIADTRSRITLTEKSNYETWNELLYGVYRCLKGLGYSWDEEKDDMWRDLINSGPEEIV